MLRVTRDTNKTWSLQEAQCLTDGEKYFLFNQSFHFFCRSYPFLSLKSPIVLSLINLSSCNLAFWFLLPQTTETAIPMQIQQYLSILFLLALLILFITANHSHFETLSSVSDTMHFSYLIGYSFLDSFHWLLIFCSNYKCQSSLGFYPESPSLPMHFPYISSSLWF